MSALIPFHYQGEPVRFTSDGWLHATTIAARFGKEPNGWLVSIETISYMIALAEALGINLSSCIVQEFNEIKGLETSKAATKARILRLAKEVGLVRTKVGPSDNGGGTWLHPKLAVVFARWLDIKFAVWCDLHIDALLRGELNEKQQFDQACKRLADAQQLASMGASEMAKFRWRKPRLVRDVEHWREQLQMTLGLEVA